MTALVYPYVVQLILDDAIGAGQLQKLNQYSLAMVGILLVEAAATYGRDYCMKVHNSDIGDSSPTRCSSWLVRIGGNCIGRSFAMP